MTQRARRSADPRYLEPVVPTNLLAVIVAIAEERGAAVARWLAGAGLSRAQIGDPAVRVSYRQARLIVRRAQRELPADFGLDVGFRQNIGTFGLLGMAMLTARTFGEAIAIGIEHHRVGGSLLEMALEAQPAGEIALVAWPRFADDDILVFECEELFASALVVCRGLAGAEFRPLKLELTYPEPAYGARYRKLFRCDVEFGARHNRALLDGRWLGRTLPTHHPVSARHALALCRAENRDLERQTEVVAAVERALRARLAENPRLTEIAAGLNVTERTLRRQLAAAGRIFREIRDRVRCARALELLRGGAISIGDVGTAIGFSEPREFRRAFKRWTGAVPRDMRAPSGRVARSG